jgi:hypothetical protein
MRKVLISLLLAGVAASPAIAAQHDDSDRHQTREERQQSRSEARSERQQSRVERQSVRQEPAPVREQRVQVREQRVQGREQRVQMQPAAPQNYVAPNPGPRVVRAPQNGGRNWQYQQQVRQQQRAVDLQQTREAIRDQRDDRRVERQQRRTRAPVVSNVPREGTQPPLRVERRRSPETNWNTSWRHDNRYDWSSWRNHHRSWFHLGFYSDPFGWGYQPYSIGWRLWPSYYSNRFWINDPWQYRLPYAPPGYQWIRYYNDALLVDTWTGQVEDVIYNFFW